MVGLALVFCTPPARPVPASPAPCSHDCPSCILCMLVTQSHPALCDPMDCRPPGFFVHGILRQEYLDSWSGLPFPSPEDLPNPGIEPWSPASRAYSLLFELQGSPWILGWAKSSFGISVPSYGRKNGLSGQPNTYPMAQLFVDCFY